MRESRGLNPLGTYEVPAPVLEAVTLPATTAEALSAVSGQFAASQQSAAPLVIEATALPAATEESSDAVPFAGSLLLAALNARALQPNGVAASARLRGSQRNDVSLRATAGPSSSDSLNALRGSSSPSNAVFHGEGTQQPSTSATSATARHGVIARAGGPLAESRVQNAVGNRPDIAMRDSAILGERRGLLYEDLGTLDRYSPDLKPLKVVHPDVDTLMERDDYALLMQMQIEHHEHNIIMFDKGGSRFHLESALGHREVHRWLAGRVYLRMREELEANVLPPIDTVRFMKIPTRPALQEVVSHFGDCIVNDCIWSYRKGQYITDLTRNSLLIVVFATPRDARIAEDLFRRDRWFATLRATMEPMKSSNKNPTDAPNWEFFNFCRKMRCELMKVIFNNCLLADVTKRMPLLVQQHLEEKAARGLLSIGSCLNQTNNNATSNAVAVRSTHAVPPPPSAVPQPPPPPVRALQAPLRAPRVVPVRSQPLRPPSRPQADERQARILHMVVSNSLEGFFKATTEAHPCRIWSSEAMISMLNEATLRHPPLMEIIQEHLDAAGERGTELRNLKRARNTTVLYGHAVERDLPVFVMPQEYEHRTGTRPVVSWIRTVDNIDPLIDALQSTPFVTVSLRANQGFEPSVRLLSIAVLDRAFVVDLMDCPLEHVSTQAMLSTLLETKAILCFESQREALRFRELCNAQTIETFEARRHGVGFMDPFKALQKCPLTPKWEPSDRAMMRLHIRYQELELYTVTYLGALLNTAYNNYLYCVPNLTAPVAEEAKLRAIAMAMILRRCLNEVPEQWSRLTS